MNAAIIQKPALRLITCKSRSFPEGNREAFNAIESRLETLRRRKFYALVYGSDQGMEYFAGLVPESKDEERQFTTEGFGIAKVEAGTRARIKLEDWESKTDQIGQIIGAMISEFGNDSSRPQIEFYRSMTELHLLVPVLSTSAENTTNGEP